MHLCTENPCPIQDIECLKFLENGYKTTYTMTRLEQFNEEVIEEIRQHYAHDMGDEGKSVLLQDVEVIFEKKLTAHKELILKMVREKAPREHPGYYCDCEETCGCAKFDEGWNGCRQEFLNNLDTI